MAQQSKEKSLPTLNHVRLNKNDLIKELEKNEETHRKQFEEALKGFEKAVVKRLEEMLENARKKKNIEQHVGLPMPQDHTDDYKRIISMLKMSLDAEVELTQGEFAQYVLDDWGWKEQFTTTNALYSRS